MNMDFKCHHKQVLSNVEKIFNTRNQDRKFLDDKQLSTWGSISYARKPSTNLNGSNMFYLFKLDRNKSKAHNYSSTGIVTTTISSLANGLGQEHSCLFVPTNYLWISQKKICYGFNSHVSLSSDRPEGKLYTLERERTFPQGYLNRPFWTVLGDLTHRIFVSFSRSGKRWGGTPRKHTQRVRNFSFSER
jgi:hypothetical protein